MRKSLIVALLFAASVTNAQTVKVSTIGSGASASCTLCLESDGTGWPITTNTTLTDTGVVATFGGDLVLSSTNPEIRYGTTGLIKYVSDGILGIGDVAAGTTPYSIRLWGDGETAATKYLSLGHDGTEAVASNTENILGIRNATTAQELRVYNTWTSATNYEALRVYWVSNLAKIVTGKGSGGGSTRILNIGTIGDSVTNIQIGDSNRWTFGNSAGAYALYPSATTNSQDLGIASQLLRSGYIATSLQGGGSKALTDATATGFVKIAVAQGTSVGARIRYTVKAADATDFQIEEGNVSVSCINKAGTVTCSTPVVFGNTVPLVTAGTLAATVFTVAEVDADTITVSANSDTSLTTTSHVIQYFTEMNAANTVTQQP